jgi:hypothetical protein
MDDLSSGESRMSDKSFIQLTLTRTGGPVLINAHHIIQVVTNTKNPGSTNVVLNETTSKGSSKTIFVRESYEEVYRLLMAQ